MRRREGIQLFSTSAIDLLACGLGAVLVLWLLVFGNQGGAMEGDRPLGSGEMRIRQFGVSHLVGFEIRGYTLESFVREGVNSAVETAIPADFEPGKAFVSNRNKFCTNMGNRWSFKATYVEIDGDSRIEISCQASDEFAREIAISFSDMRAAHEVGLTIKTCHAGEIHYLEMQSIDRRGVSDARYVFHCEGTAHTALSSPPTSVWERFFHAQIQQEVERMCPPDSWEKPFNYMVFDCDRNIPLSMGVKFTGDGAVRFVEPDLNLSAPEVDTVNGTDIRTRIVTWSSGTYGNGRIPAGLPPC